MQTEKKQKRLYIYIILGLIIGIFIKLFVLDILHVSGISMEPTIKNGSVLFVNKLAYGIPMPNSTKLITRWKSPLPGDVVIFLYNNKIVVKRCIAEEGTRLDYLTNSGYSLIVGKKKIPLTEEQYFRMKNSKSVPKGYILVIGDNYKHSVDSRYYGFVCTENIIGKVVGK